MKCQKCDKHIHFWQKSYYMSESDEELIHGKCVESGYVDKSCEVKSNSIENLKWLEGIE